MGEVELLTSQRFQEGAGGAKAFGAGWLGGAVRRAARRVLAHGTKRMLVGCSAFTIREIRENPAPDDSASAVLLFPAELSVAAHL